MYERTELCSVRFSPGRNPPTKGAAGGDREGPLPEDGECGPRSQWPGRGAWAVGSVSEVSARSLSWRWNLANPEGVPATATMCPGEKQSICSTTGNSLPVSNRNCVTWAVSFRLIFSRKPAPGPQLPAPGSQPPAPRPPAPRQRVRCASRGSGSCPGGGCCPADGRCFKGTSSCDGETRGSNAFPLARKPRTSFPPTCSSSFGAAKPRAASTPQ